MKTFLPTLLILITCHSFTQNIWEPINFPDTLYPQAINAENEDFIFVAAQGPLGVIYLLRSNDDGITWETLDLTTPYFNPFFTISYNSDVALFVGNRHNIFRSIDNGNSFDTVFTNYDTQDVVTKIRSSKNNEVYALGLALIIRSTDNGNSWDTIYRSDSSQYFEDIDFGANGNIFAVGGAFDSAGSGFYRSLDNGETWENIGITDKYLQAIKVNSDGVLIVSGLELDGVYSSSDLGSTWIYTSELQANVIESYYNDKLIAGSNIVNSTGCWFSDDWGSNWSNLVDSLINPRVHQISISPSNHVYIQSNYYVDCDQLFKSIKPLMNAEYHLISTKIKLYPNPSSGTLSVINNTSVRIKQFVIYNQKAQKVMEGKLINDRINVSILQSGIYIIDFELENKNVRMKLIIE